ncbi:MAG: carbon-nitrogen hydrolase family protein [Clostridiales bacterium]|nr:carbon-nitrogen hydrolase family protein [Clostridiales bacterium]
MSNKNINSRISLALCQMKVVKNKISNIEKAVSMLETAASRGAEIAVLPEMFNCPYDISYFREYSEIDPIKLTAPENHNANSVTICAISEAARRLSITVVAGSIPENDNNRIYNTCFVFDSEGRIIAKHRKIHLFDIDMPEKITFKESAVLSPGNTLGLFDTDFCKAGVMICYDMRFPELMRQYALAGAEVVFVPAAFNMVTGPAHWKLTIRARALDNQIYVAAVSPSRDISTSYIAYGHSMLAGPCGDTVATLKEDEGILFSEINMEKIKEIRNQLPLLKHRREDVYNKHIIV